MGGRARVSRLGASATRVQPWLRRKASTRSRTFSGVWSGTRRKSMETWASVGMALARSLPHLGRAQAADVERRVHQPLLDGARRCLPSVPGRARRAARPPPAHGGHRRPLRRVERPDVVVEAGDQDPAFLVPQARHQVRQRHRRVRRPVAVVAAVQRTQRTVDRQLQPGDAARAVEDLHAPAGMHRTVAENPGVGLQQIEVLAQDRRQMLRACSSSPPGTASGSPTAGRRRP